MGRQPVSVRDRAEATELRNELLGRPGPRDNASEQDVETAGEAEAERLIAAEFYPRVPEVHHDLGFLT